MELKIKDRLILLSLLPGEGFQGSFLTLKIIRDLQNDLGFSEEEYKTYKLTENDGKVTWDNAKEQMKEVEIGEKASSLFADALKTLSEKEKLSQAHFELYERFVKPDAW